MSWTTNRQEIVTALEGLGYREVPNGDVDKGTNAFNNKAFTVRAVGSDKVQNLTSAAYITSDIVVLDVLYKAMNPDEEAEMYDLFLAIEQSVNSLSRFAQHKEKRTFTRMKDYQWKGTLSFYYGIRTCP